jgi:hypothetical protein
MSKNREKRNDDNEDISYDPLPIKNDSDDKLTAFADALAELRRSFSLHMEAFEMRAKLNKAFYDEFIKAGFTPEQALELVKVKGS